MHYVTVRELCERSGEIWRRVAGGEEFVVMRKGKPFALLVHTSPQAVEERLRALRAAEFGSVAQAIQRQALTTGASSLTDADIQAEIEAARYERRGAVPPPAAPAAAER